jgi:hypothetical protein
MVEYVYKLTKARQSDLAYVKELTSAVILHMDPTLGKFRNFLALAP